MIRLFANRPNSSKKCYNFIDSINYLLYKGWKPFVQFYNNQKNLTLLHNHNLISPTHTQSEFLAFFCFVIQTNFFPAFSLLKNIKTNQSFVCFALFVLYVYSTICRSKIHLSKRKCLSPNIVHNSAPYFHCPRWPSCLFCDRCLLLMLKSYTCLSLYTLGYYNYLLRFVKV